MTRHSRIKAGSGKAEYTIVRDTNRNPRYTFGLHTALSREANAVAVRHLDAYQNARFLHSSAAASGVAKSLGKPAVHDFSGIRVCDPQSSPSWAVTRQTLRSIIGTNTRKKISTNSTSAQPGDSPEGVVHAISAGGSGTVVTTYTPEANDKSTKIVFIQVMRELLDAVPVKPSVAAPAFAYQDADTTSEFYHVDYVSGEKDPYYNGDDRSDFGPQGNASTKVAASTSDSPSYSDASFPVGKSKLLWEFRTAAFSAAGSDAGTYYGYSDWSYEKDKGVAGRTRTTGTNTGNPGSKFESAVKLWNSNHGFKMPGGNGILGGIVGGLVGAGLGAAIGSAAGGAGALVGGALGLAAGAIVGALVSGKNVSVR